MNTPQTTADKASSNQALWGVIGALGVAVAGLAGYLVYDRTKAPTVEPVAASSAALPPSPVATPAVQAPAVTASTPTAAAPVVAKAAAPKRHVTTAPAPATTSPAVVDNPPVAVAKPLAVCSYCGTVESVTALEQKGSGSGLGAVAGGLLGAVVGHQVGGGTGKDLATVVGAVGGGLAGNEVERNVKKTHSYQISVRMDDGSVRSFQQVTALSVGQKVTVGSDNSLRAQ